MSPSTTICALKQGVSFKSEETVVATKMTQVSDAKEPDATIQSQTIDVA